MPTTDRDSLWTQWPHPSSRRLDGWIGERVESAVRSHHRRRLLRAGHLEQIDPSAAATSLWAAGDPPARDGNDLQVLIDGAQALPLLAHALAQARSSVHIAGWHVARISASPATTRR